jgi:hypothetical protein
MSSLAKVPGSGHAPHREAAPVRNNYCWLSILINLYTKVVPSYNDLLPWGYESTLTHPYLLA